MRGFEVAQATALYLVAHGVFDATRARPVGLALAGAAGHDGVAWADDVEGWRVPELVFLATCSAARDQERAGEDGTSHLGGAFLRAGARCVITSRYALELGVTNVLAQRFFTALGRGELPAAAMRWARAELSSDPLYADALEPELLVVFGLGR
jgi:CHAT domain-containing protein